MIIKNVKTGGRFEEIGAYSRVKRVGPFVFVAGTTAIEPSGKLHAPGDTTAQSRYIFKRIEDAMRDVGATLQQVVRTRAYFTDMATAGEFVQVHGEVFKGIDPVTCGVEAGLTMDGMMIEIEVDALILDSNGEFDFN